MAKAIDRLSAIGLKSKGLGMHADGAGLYLCVGAGGRRSWIFRYKFGGKPHEMGLGPLHTIGLKEARERARRCREQLLDGINPLGARQAQRQAARLDRAKAITFQECAERYIEAHRPTWRNAKHAAQWPSTLETYVYPAFGDLPVQAIDEGLIVKVLEPIWSTKTETATRVRQRIEAVLDWASVRKFRRGENPARWKGCLESLLPKPASAKRAVRRATGRAEHHAALPYDEIAPFVAELRRQDGMAARALEFAVLTAGRTGEVIGARWDEVNFAERIWTVPAERMKAGREHRVPLAAPAIALLEALAQLRRPREDAPVIFAGPNRGKPLSNMAMLMLLRRMGHGDLTVHGFRSTFRDWAAERTNFPAEVVEMALAHAVSDKVEAAYRRGDLFQKRRQLMDAWARCCDQLKSVAPDVLVLRPAAR
ncbi:MAG TPA: integrase arm-type DNA-binding domain-containing protein [Stellaceae bacterium]|nr:integrase arm-type DNA-binding domain-containing protein [Stellaceae bacterium]